MEVMGCACADVVGTREGPALARSYSSLLELRGGFLAC